MVLYLQSYLKKKRFLQMLKEKTILLVGLAFLVTSCSDTWSTVKRGLTGSKQKSTDEFLVKKKDPLVLPPDFEDLPTPDEYDEAINEMSSIEKTLGGTSSNEESFSSSNSTEESILKKIRKR